MKRLKQYGMVLYMIFLVSALALLSYLPNANALEPTPVEITNSVSITPPAAPSAPYGLAISGISDAGATISWAPVATANQYSVWINGTRWTGVASPGVTISDLQPYTIYDVYVTAINESGESTPSTTASFTTLPPIPTSPATPIIASVNDNTALINWEPLPPAQFIQVYRVYVDGTPVADVTPQEGIQAANLTNLHEGNHIVSISGINANKEGPLSTPVHFTIGALPAPSGLQMTNHSTDTIWLRWNSVQGAYKYIININGQLAGETQQSNYKLEGLQAGQRCIVDVVAVMPDGNLSQPASIQLDTILADYPLTKESLVQDIFSYCPDVVPGLVMIFVVGASFALARTAKESIM